MIPGGSLAPEANFLDTHKIQLHFHHYQLEGEYTALARKASLN